RVPLQRLRLPRRARSVEEIKMARPEALEPLAFHFKDDGSIPNNPKLPLLVYKQALHLGSGPGADPAAAFERLFATHGWSDGWRSGIYPFPHYHPRGHEVLGIARGHARVRFGGE